MCNAGCILFGALNLKPEEIRGKRVIEIGAYDLNGTLRPLLESYQPAEYIGVDIKPGPGVDLVCGAEDVLERFGRESFDAVISTELLEHVRNWRRVVHNIKNICKAGGAILISTRSYGCPYHGHPYDFWRYELEDMKCIFSDCAIEKLEKDVMNGVFVKVRKPLNFVEQDRSDYTLYSILLDKRVTHITGKDARRRAVFANFKVEIKNILSSPGRLLSQER